MEVCGKKNKAILQHRLTLSKLGDINPIAEAIANCFVVSEYIKLGLSELLINAHEHGNLGIGGSHKTLFLNEGTWQEEVEKRENAPKNANKFITLECMQRSDSTVFRITDQGEGFNWRRYLSPEAMEDATFNGRGIALANQLCFEALLYNEAGNQVTAISYQLPELPLKLPEKKLI